MKNKKEKKSKKEKKTKMSLVEKLMKNADTKNSVDCAPIFEELIKASMEGEYEKVVQMKINQSHYLKTFGFLVSEVDQKPGYYLISWQLF
jgi:hypothetical protein